MFLLLQNKLVIKKIKIPALYLVRSPNAQIIIDIYKYFDD